MTSGDKCIVDITYLNEKNTWTPSSMKCCRNCVYATKDFLFICIFSK